MAIVNGRATRVGVVCIAALATVWTACTSDRTETPPAAVANIIASIRADGLHGASSLTASWTETTLKRWDAVTHDVQRPGTDLSVRFYVVELDSDTVMTCDLCIVSWMGGHRPAGHYVIRTGRMGATGGPETIIGPRHEFRLDQLGHVDRTTPSPASSDRLGA